MAENYDVTYNPTEVVRGMNKIVSDVTESAIKYGDAFYKFNYILSISWASPEAKKFEAFIETISGYIGDTIQTINYILDRYDEGIAELTSVNEGDPIVFPRVPALELKIFPLHEKLDGKVGIDKKMAIEAKEEFFVAFEENIQSYTDFKVDIGLKDVMVEQEVSEAMIATKNDCMPTITKLHDYLNKLIDKQTGVIDASEKMAYETLVETVSSMETIPDDNVEYKICKEWINCKDDLVKMVKDIKLETMGPDADLADEEASTTPETNETTEPSNSAEEPVQEEAADSSNSNPKPTSMPAKASLGNGPVSVLR